MGAAALKLPVEMERATAAQQADRSTHFIFQHKVFTIDGAYFAKASDGNPAFHVNLGDITAAVLLRSVRRAFDIPDADEEMLRIVEKSLRFVRKIHPNDSIPREVLDGTASWAIDESHHHVAHSRLTLQLASWMTGNTTTHLARDQIGQLAKNPAVISRVQAAVDEIAQRVGLAADSKNVVIDRIEAFARELSYVEAIRERFEGAKVIETKVAKLLGIYKADRFVGDNLTRIAALMKEPLSAFAIMFAQVDKNIADIIGICQAYDQKVLALRATRDMLFELWLLWEPILTRWHEQPIEKSKDAEDTVRITFQFLVRHYPLQSTWKKDNGWRR